MGTTTGSIYSDWGEIAELTNYNSQQTCSVHTKGP